MHFYISYIATGWPQCHTPTPASYVGIFGHSSWRSVTAILSITLKSTPLLLPPTDFHSLEDLLDSNDESLFRSIRYNPQHVLHQLLPPPKHTGFRSRGHGLTLSVIPSEFMRKNFTNRMLYCCSLMIYIDY